MLQRSTTKTVLGRFSAVPRPFLRWAGSKQALLQSIVPLLPKSYGRYYEPFLGSGALFFHLKPKRATLTDVSGDLIQVWKAVRDNHSEILEYLRPLVPDRDLYYRIRSSRSEDPTVRSAEFIYLNKTCWNGLYRVNSKGQFNVPYGAPRSDTIIDEENLLECSRVLRGREVSIRQSDFAESLSRVKAEDLVYLDPPYVTKHNFNGFRDYNEKLFRWEDQIRLADLAERLRRKGAHVVVSNAFHKDILDLYPNFAAHTITRSSTLSSDKAFRGTVAEVVLTSSD